VKPRADRVESDSKRKYAETQPTKTPHDKYRRRYWEGDEGQKQTENIRGLINQGGQGDSR